MNTVPSRLDLLELDIDIRLSQLWAEAIRMKTWTLEDVATYMRAAYGKAYCDALTEPERGQLCYEHGYKIPAVSR